MASGTFYPAASGDDGDLRTETDAFYNYDYIIIGNNGYIYDFFVRFPSVNILQGAIIDSAFVRFTAYSSLSATVCNETLKFNDIDNAIAPINAAEFKALTETTASVSWNAIKSWVVDTQYDSPDISTLVQEVIDRVGWSLDNALMLLGHGNVSDPQAHRIIKAFNLGSGYAELHVTWSDAINADVTIPMMTAEGFTGIYSAPSIPMTQAEGFTGIYSAPSIPMIRAAGTLSDNMVHVASSVTIPSMTAAITQAKQIWGAVTVPMMRASLAERETVLGNVKIPMMTASLSSGLHADVSATVPMMTAAGLFSGRCAVTVPMMTAALTGKVGRVGNISVKLPMMTVSVTGKVEHLGNISVTVPMMLALAELITGKVITGAATIPMMTAALSSYEDIDVDSDVSIPMMMAYLSGNVARFTSCSVVLRYADTYDCIGKIEVDLPMITASIEGS